jgi:mono/diheme cytochrome c family protein
MSPRWLRRLFPTAVLLGLACSLTSASGSPTAEHVAPAWVVDPTRPGDNLPRHGRSLFDRLFAVSRGAQAEIELPFPFSALLARVEAQLQPATDGSLPALKSVLIPLGRSLQRTAAAPDHFAFPRVVAAVDGQPANAAALLLKDRLYIGYQERSAVLEVISYNEEEGRFEFQLVKDYRAGGKPRVFHANRLLCFACHQNGAPIFARALWDETNANPRVASELLASGGSFHGIAARRGVDLPYAIDNASDRANGLALTQLLWRQGCGGDEPAAQRCRAGLFAASLRHALSGGQVWVGDAAFADAVATPLRNEARRRWPQGLAVGSADLPNRDPLSGVIGLPAEPARRVALSHVAAAFDPLLPRSAAEVWLPDAPGALRRATTGLAEFVAAPDRQRLAAALAGAAKVAGSEIRLPCRFEDNAAGSRRALRCGGPGEGVVEGRLELRGGRPLAGVLTRLTLPGGTALTGIEVIASGKPTATRTTLQPRAGGAGELPRSAAGDAIVGLDLTHGAARVSGEIGIRLRHDFAVAQRAIDRLLAGPAAATLFGATPFPRQPLFQALFAELGAPAPAACCQAAALLPPARLELAAAAPGATGSDPASRSFQPYCAACHQSAETFPPNFLQGNADEVAARLRHCAPRLYVRLAMADEPPARRQKTPMPPESLLPVFGIDSDGWRNSPARKALLAQVGEWLRAESGQPAQLERLLAGGYEALRPCLPAH